MTAKERLLAQAKDHIRTATEMQAAWGPREHLMCAELLIVFAAHVKEPSEAEGDPEDDE